MLSQSKEKSLKFTFSGSPPLTGTATLTVNIRDVNDNAPYFSDTYNFQVGAATQAGETVGKWLKDGNSIFYSFRLREAVSRGGLYEV